MIVYFGTRSGGAVDGQAGEYAITRCFHIFFLPIIPLGWMWVTGESGGGTVGTPMRPHLRSLVALYLRSWGLVFTIGLLLNASLTGEGLLYLAGGILMGAAVGLTWRWRSRRSRRALRAGELTHAILGSFCGPRYLKRDHAVELRGELEDIWPRYGDGRSPSDIARYGASNAEQATLAHVILRLAACTSRGPNSRDAARLADRIVEKSPISHLLDGFMSQVRGVGP